MTTAKCWVCDSPAFASGCCDNPACLRTALDESNRLRTSLTVGPCGKCGAIRGPNNKCYCDLRDGPDRLCLVCGRDDSHANRLLQLAEHAEKMAGIYRDSYATIYAKIVEWRNATSEIPPGRFGNVEQRDRITAAERALADLV